MTSSVGRMTGWGAAAVDEFEQGTDGLLGDLGEGLADRGERGVGGEGDGGRRRVAMITGPLDTPGGVLRLEGFCALLGRKADKRLI